MLWKLQFSWRIMQWISQRCTLSNEYRKNFKINEISGVPRNALGWKKNVVWVDVFIPNCNSMKLSLTCKNHDAVPTSWSLNENKICKTYKSNEIMLLVNQITRYKVFTKQVPDFLLSPLFYEAQFLPLHKKHHSWNSLKISSLLGALTSFQDALVLKQRGWILKKLNCKDRS